MEYEELEVFNVVGRRRVLQMGLALTAGTIASGTLAGCSDNTSDADSGGKPQRGGTLVYATDTLPANESMDPAKGVNDGMYLLQGCIREGIAFLDENQVPHPRLASWTANKDFTRWTLKVRRGVTFHDGTDLTARDLEWMVVRTLDPNLGSSLTSRVASSMDKNGVKVLDDGTLELNLTRPDSALMGSFARVAAFIVPKGTTDFEKGIGTGPFRLKSYASGKGFQVVANSGYWRTGVPFLKSVQVLQVPEASTRVQGVTSGQTHGTEIDYQSVPQVKGASSATTYIAENAALLMATMNQDMEPFTDVRVRQALKYSIDRKKLIKIAYAGYGEITADVPISASDPQYPAAMKSRVAQDLDKARQLMEAAGHPDGLKLTLETPSDSLHATFALAFATSVKGSPFEIKVHQSDPSTYYDKIWMDSALTTNDWNRRAPIEAMPLMLDKDAEWNTAHFNDKEFQNDISKARASGGSKQNVAIAEAAQRVVDTSGAAIPGYRHRVFAFKKTVHDAVFDPATTLDLSKAWIG